MAKVIATRLNTVLPKLINTMQTGFMRGRSINDNIVKLINLINHCNENNISAVLINVDFEKAFDSTEWLAIRLTMEKFGFGEKFMDAVSTLYNDAQF